MLLWRQKVRFRGFHWLPLAHVSNNCRFGQTRDCLDDNDEGHIDVTVALSVDGPHENTFLRLWHMSFSSTPSPGVTYYCPASEASHPLTSRSP